MTDHDSMTPAFPTTVGLEGDHRTAGLATATSAPSIGQRIKTTAKVYVTTRSVAPGEMTRSIFDGLLTEEPSISDGQAFHLCELGHLARRGLHQRVRRKLRNLPPHQNRKAIRFPKLDVRYTVVQADGIARQIEHAQMTRDEWLSAEGLLMAKAEQTERKADALRMIRLAIDRVWAANPGLTVEEALTQGCGGGSGTDDWEGVR